jgi:hypothetical protein
MSLAIALNSASCRDFDYALIRGTVGDHTIYTSLLVGELVHYDLPATVDQDIK